MRRLNFRRLQTMMVCATAVATAALLAAGIDLATGDDGPGVGSPPAALALGAEGEGRCGVAEVDDEEPDKFETRLFVAESDGSKMKPLTELPEYQAQGSPNWSRDGKYIVFDAWKPQDGETLTQSQIIVVNADGTKPRVVGPGAMPSFSPAGGRIIFSSPKSGGVWIMGSEGADDEIFPIDAQGWGADWSPDGRIVYAANRGGKANLIVHDFVEGRDVTLFDKQQSPYRQIFWNMTWSPDGKQIAFKGSTTEGKIEIAIVDARGESFGFIRRFEGDVVPSLGWSAAPNRILLIRQNPVVERFQLFTLDPATKLPPEVLAVHDPRRHYADIACSPDGKKVVFSCQKRLPRK